MSTEAIVAVFVYGTLKRGQVREHCWPRRPNSVEPATIRGRLVDLGPYPALLDGDSLVLGELWRFDPADMGETLRALDEVECFGVDDVDLYVRRVVDCDLLAGGGDRAFAYYLADPATADGHPAAPVDDAGRAYWLPRADLPPGWEDA